jgi:hypothetical protein
VIKLDKKQPWRLWAFVLLLNLIGFLGLFFMSKHGVDFALL